MSRTVLCIAVVVVMAQASRCLSQFRLDIVQVAQEMGESAPLVPASMQPDVEEPRIVFLGNLGGVMFADAHNEPAMLRKLNAELETTITLLEIEHQITPAQKEKLWLAGRRDLASIADDAELIRSMAIDPAKDPNGIRNAFVRIQEIQQRMKGGALREDSMMSKVTRKILLAQVDANQGHEFGDREQFAYQAALKLIVAQLELVAPLGQQQRLKLLQRIKEMDRPGSLTAEMTYSTAIKELMKPTNAPDILDNEQLAVLKEMRKSIVLGRLRPHGLIKSRSAVADSLRK